MLISSGSLSRYERALDFKMDSSSSSSCGGGSDSFNGKKIYYEGVCSGLQPKIGEGAVPGKKGRTAAAAAQGGQPPRCQVEGCEVDMSGAKPYYCRHKVCALHSKAPIVIVAGLHQRFCQQCSRFHQLPEFDQGKRSCRRRLAGHNERRRKPPPAPVLSSHFAALAPSIYDYRGRDCWAKIEQSSNCDLPWSQPPPLPSPRLRNSLPSYSDSSSALSLLSNWGSTAQPSDLGLNSSFLGSALQPQPSWDFQDDDDGSFTHVGLGNII